MICVHVSIIIMYNIFFLSIDTVPTHQPLLRTPVCCEHQVQIPDFRSIWLKQMFRRSMIDDTH